MVRGSVCQTKECGACPEADGGHGRSWSRDTTWSNAHEATHLRDSEGGAEGKRGWLRCLGKQAVVKTRGLEKVLGNTVTKYQPVALK